MLRLPTVGGVTLVVANIIVLIVLCFYGFDTSDQWSFEDIAYRTGYMSIAQLPLIFLLAGKNNIIGYLTGMSYEKLNWLHRWTSRCLPLTATIHFGYWLGDWWPYGDFVGQKLRTDPLTIRGLVAWCVLVWITFSSVTPIRGWSYEFFVIQHVVSFAVLIAFVYLHVAPWPEMHAYIWIPVALFFFDRIIRGLRTLYINLSIFHPQQKRSGQMSSLWACKAEFTPLPHNTTRISIQNPPIGWKAGQHMFLSCHSIVPLQSHPFTIASIHEDGRMEFIVKAERGGTKKFFKHAEKLESLPVNQSGTQQVQLRTVALEGPYGSLRPLRQFDSVVFLAGTTGATFTVPLMRDIVAAWKSNSKAGSFLRVPNTAVTRHIRFVWVVKSRGQLGWFSSQLSAVVEDVKTLQGQGLKIAVDISVYCTCDESFTEEYKSLVTSLPEKKGLHQSEVEGLPTPRESAVDEKVALEKQTRAEEPTTEVHEIASSTPSIGDVETKESCGSDENCCCKATIEDEDAIASANHTCTCCSPKSDTTKAKAAPATTMTTERSDSHTDSETSSLLSKKMLLHPSIGLFNGRPQPRNIIRKSLEQALGESAVVACGPTGLTDQVRQDCVRLSDERAIHKGTGAQGLYCHIEGFGY